MESIHILAVVYSVNDRLLVNMLRQWELDDEAIDLGVFVELLDLSDELFLRDGLIKALRQRDEADLLASLDLARYVGLTGTVMAHDDSAQTRRALPSSDHLLYLLCDLLLDLGRSGLAI